MAELTPQQEGSWEHAELYRSLVETCSDAITITDLTGRITCVSPKTLELHGYTTDQEMIGLSAFDLIAPEDHEKARANLERTLSEGMVKGVRYSILRKDGSVSPCELSASVITERDGKPTGFIASVRDLTDRHHVEEQLQISRAMLEAIVESIPFDFFALDASGRYRLLNSVSRSHWGDVVGQRPEDLPIDEATLAQWLENNRRAMNGEIVDEEVQFEIDGAHRTFRNIIAPIHRSGKTLGILGVNYDCTEQKRIEQELRDTREIFYSVFTASPYSIELYDTEGRLIDANPACLELFGVTSLDEVKGFSLFDNPNIPDDLLQRVKDGEAVSYETEFDFDLVWRHRLYETQKTGTMFVEAYISPWLNRGYLAHMQDITRRKRAEEERLKLQAQVHHAQKLESLGLLAGTIAHDFNNLLLSIQGNAELVLRRVSPSSKVESELQRIVTAADRASELAGQMLTFAREDQLSPEEVDLSTVVKEMAILLESSIGGRATLQLDLAPDLPRIEADAIQLGQVVMNLVTNASESLSGCPGSILVATSVMQCSKEYLSSLEMSESLEPGEYVCLEVSDTGCGMDEETVNRVLDPFFTTKQSGRGLGLASLAGIVRRHGGALSITSEPGVGASFRVLFPVSHQGAEELKDRAQQIKGAEAPLS